MIVSGHPPLPPHIDPEDVILGISTPQGQHDCNDLLSPPLRQRKKRQKKTTKKAVRAMKRSQVCSPHSSCASPQQNIINPQITSHSSSSLQKRTKTSNSRATDDMKTPTLIPHPVFGFLFDDLVEVEGADERKNDFSSHVPEKSSSVCMQSLLAQFDDMNLLSNGNQQQCGLTRRLRACKDELDEYTLELERLEKRKRQIFDEVEYLKTSMKKVRETMERKGIRCEESSLLTETMSGDRSGAASVRSTDAYSDYSFQESDCCEESSHSSSVSTSSDDVVVD